MRHVTKFSHPLSLGLCLLPSDCVIIILTLQCLFISVSFLCMAKTYLSIHKFQQPANFEHFVIYFNNHVILTKLINKSLRISLTICLFVLLLYYLKNLWILFCTNGYSFYACSLSLYLSLYLSYDSFLRYTEQFLVKMRPQKKIFAPL